VARHSKRKMCAALAERGPRTNDERLAQVLENPHFGCPADGFVPFLLTWNCRHLANATMRPSIETVCAAKGVKAPIICTPEELLESTP